MNYKLFILSLLIPVLLNAQDYKYQGNRLILGTNEPGNNSVYLYTPSYLAKPIFTDTLAALNVCPEQLMESIISVNNQKWVDYNTLGGEKASKKYQKEYFDNRKSLNKETTFLELRLKYTFSFQGNEMAIIKYYYHTPVVKPTSGAYVMQKLGKRWYYTSTTFTSDLAIVIMRFQEEKLKKILMGLETDDLKINEVIRKVKDQNGNINTNKLVAVFNDWYTNNNSEMLNYFQDPHAW